MRRSVCGVLVTTLTPLVAGCAATSTTPSPAPTPTAPATGTMGRHAVAGPVEDMRWGPVQVTILVQGTRIADVQATAPTERARSADINEQAVPLLRQEVLQAQSARIDLVSGAILTSEAYAASLQGALSAAHL